MCEVKTKNFIKKAKLVHSDKYDYYKTNYVNSATKVIIVCKEHGAFEQASYNHLRGQNCPICSPKGRKK